MPVYVRGTVPFPPNTNAVPIQQFSANISRVVADLQQHAQSINSTAQTAGGCWGGTAADNFVRHLQGRSQAIDEIASKLGKAVPILDTLATAITIAEAAYTVAAGIETAARFAIPFSAPAVAAAITAEEIDVIGYQVAAAAAGAALIAVEVELAQVLLAGVNRGPNTNPPRPIDPVPDPRPRIPEIGGGGNGGNGGGGGGRGGGGNGGRGGGGGCVPPPPVNTSKMPNTQGMTEDQKFDVYREYLKKHGMDIADQKQLPLGEAILLHLDSPDATTANGQAGNDRFVVIWSEMKDGKIVRHVEEFDVKNDVVIDPNKPPVVGPPIVPPKPTTTVTIPTNTIPGPAPMPAPTPAPVPTPTIPTIPTQTIPTPTYPTQTIPTPTIPTPTIPTPTIPTPTIPTPTIPTPTIPTPTIPTPTIPTPTIPTPTIPTPTIPTPKAPTPTVPETPGAPGTPAGSSTAGTGTGVPTPNTGTGSGNPRDVNGDGTVNRTDLDSLRKLLKGRRRRKMGHGHIDSYPFKSPAEMERFGKAFDKLVGTFRVVTHKVK
jgi:hypothetical protein